MNSKHFPSLTGLIPGKNGSRTSRGAVLTCLLTLSGFSSSHGQEVAVVSPPPVVPVPQIAAPAAPVVTAVSFVDEVVPLLEARCVECHREGKDKGGLRLDARSFAFEGGDSGPAVVAKDPGESLLIERVCLPADDDEIMPPEGEPLTDAERAVLTRWVREGAVWEEGVTLRQRSPEEIAQMARAEAKKAQLREIRLYPDHVTLEKKRDFQSVVVLAVYDDDVTLDITRFAKLSLADPALASLQHGKLTPLADGQTELLAAYAGKEVRVPVKVHESAVERPVSFKLDVMPVFMRGNCNGGGCHGSARGKDGFMLSLFGYDPDGDYHRITRQMNGRRINLAVPEESLLIEKAVGKVAHTGGKLFEIDSPMSRTIIEWLSNNAPEDPKDLAVVERVEIFPKQIVLEGPQSLQQLTVKAYYSDGTDRDVTPLAVFQTNNETSVKVTPEGLCSSGERGEAFVTARFDNFTVGCQGIVIPENLQYTKPQPVEVNYIDQLVNAKLHKLRILPSGNASDEVFLRRAFADIIGVLPSETEFAEFMNDPAPDKRARLIDRLVNRPEFTDLWVMKWAELLQIRSEIEGGNRNAKRALLYYNWLRDRISNNVPMNQVVNELLSANGGTFSNPATNFYEMEADKLKLTENIAQVFMGMRIQCAQCHNHPFDRWTMNDYYGFAAFFSQVARKPSQDPREIVIFNGGGGEVPHPVTQAAVPPTFLGGGAAQIEAGQDRRDIVADWLSSPENPFFARNLANMTWAHFFGLGIIEPVDDVRISNPASNPELLDALASKLKEYNYDFRKLVTDICNSSTYQRTTDANESNASDTRNFSHSLVRRMRAEVVLDAISQVTDTPNKFRGLPLGARAAEIYDGSFSDYFLTTFGRATRATVCSCEVKMEPNLSQALHLINGDATGERIRRGQLIKKLRDAGKADPEIIESLFIRAFSRKPLPQEAEALGNQLKDLPDDQKNEAIEDVFWAILNAKEFLFNH